MDKLQFRLLVGGGITFVAGPMLGIGATVMLMCIEFSRLGKDSIVGPQSLSERIGESLLLSAIGVGIGLVGFAALVAGFLLWLNDCGRLERRRRAETL